MIIFIKWSAIVKQHVAAGECEFKK